MTGIGPPFQCYPSFYPLVAAIVSPSAPNLVNPRVDQNIYKLRNLYENQSKHRNLRINQVNPSNDIFAW